jgi:hypothetical protein
MFIIKNLVKRFFVREPPLPLGRWNIDYCSKKTNNRVDLSNEDHCGPCGQYAITKKPEKLLLLNDKITTKNN